MPAIRAGAREIHYSSAWQRTRFLVRDMMVGVAEESPLTDVLSHRARRPGISGWTVATWAIALVACLPVVSIVVIATGADGEAWRHLAATILPRAFGRTLLLMAGVGCLTLLIGVTTAWLVSCCTFPGRRWFAWLLVLPLAMPTYIVAFCYLELFDYSGWVQTGIRTAFGFQSAADYWFPSVRSLEGAIVLLSLVLYPYVYITARASFLQQSVSALEAGRTLGHGPWSCFFRIALPMARPAVAAGVALALMETINDIGAVELLGVQTLTVSIYQTWLQRGSLAGAAQIACALLLIAVALLVAEKLARRGRRFHALGGVHRLMPMQDLSGPGQMLAMLACFLPILLGFLLPAAVLVDGALTRDAQAQAAAFLRSAGNSMLLAFAASAITVVCGVVLAYAHRLRPTGSTPTIVRVAGIGYAVPGTVLAVGLLAPLAWFDNAVSDLAERLFGAPTGLILSGSVAALLIAYVCRFLAVASNGVEAGFRKASPNMDAAARTLGRSPARALFEVHVPLLAPALFGAAVLVFVDAMKELPATLLLRPFNFETLATQVYLSASLERFAEASLPALAIVAAGIAPVLLLHATTSLIFRKNSPDRRFSAALT